MPVDDKKIRLRSVLAGKSTEELEELLALSFSMEDGAETDEAYITTIMEVIREREEKEADQEKRQAEVDAAWREFQEYRAERDREKAEADGMADASGKFPGEPSRPQEKVLTAKKPGRVLRSCAAAAAVIVLLREKAEADGMADASGKFPGEPSRPQEKVLTAKKPGRVLRSCAAAAAVIVLLCGTAYAFGWNIFQALADWTAETFQFLTGTEPEMADYGVFENLYRSVSAETDVSAVPRWAPEGTKEVEQPRTSIRSDKTRIVGEYLVEDREFTVRITIYNEIPEIYDTIYQKNDGSAYPYEAGGITHYIVENVDNVSAMWTNGYIEGHIQGDISVKELQLMIDSIYEE